jgi:hypothetical protein
MKSPGGSPRGSDSGGDGGAAARNPKAPAKKRAKKNKDPGPDANADDADASKALVDDMRPEEDIKGADGEYALFPKGHQPIFHEPGEHPALLCFGGRRWTRSSKAWQRLKIDDQELRMKASKEKYFRVAPPHEQNTTRHFHHSGPHLSMVFDITEQNTPDSGDETLKILTFLTHMVNQSTDLRGCMVTTHQTDLDIAPGKGKAVCGLFYHGGHRKGSGGISAKKPPRNRSAQPHFRSQPFYPEIFPYLKPNPSAQACRRRRRRRRNGRSRRRNSRRRSRRRGRAS